MILIPVFATGLFGAASVAAAIRRPGMLLAAYLFIPPLYKGALQPFLLADATMILAASSVLGFGARLYRRQSIRVRSLPWLLWSALTGVVITATVHAVDQTIAVRHAAEWTMLVFLPLLLATRVAEDQRHVRQFILTTALLFALVVGIAAAGLPFQGSGELVSALGSNRVELARAAYLLPIILIAARPVIPTKFWLPALAISVVGLVVGIATGSRGALVAFGLIALGASVRWIASKRGSRRRWALLGLGVAGSAALLLLVAAMLPGYALLRFALLWEYVLSIFGSGSTEAGGASIGTREQLFSLAWSMFSANPVSGAGTGAYEVVVRDVFGTDLYEYPHNIALQFGAELGIIGLVLFAGLAAAALLPRHRNAAELAITLTGLFLLISGMFSSDIYASRSLWGFLLLGSLTAPVVSTCRHRTALALPARVVVVHLTSAHPANDPRIVLKECRSLSERGFSVTLVAPSIPDVAVPDDIRFIPVTPASTRLNRMIVAVARVYRAAAREDGQIYHLHDPELIPVGLILKSAGKTVIYDAHEDLPTQVMSKEYLPRHLRKLVSLASRGLIWIAGLALDATVAATPAIATGFPNRRTVVVQNFASPKEFDGSAVQYSARPHHVVYVGRVTKYVGIYEMLAAAADPRLRGVRLTIAGTVAPQLANVLRTSISNADVAIPGQLSRSEVTKLLSSARIGLCILHPLPNYLDSYPTKLFEYMAAGIPVIASDFHLWRSIVNEAQCGLLVDPLSPSATAEAIRYLLDNPREAELMGQRGRRAVEEHYSWVSEERKLYGLYSSLLEKPPPSMVQNVHSGRPRERR